MKLPDLKTLAFALLFASADVLVLGAAFALAACSPKPAADAAPPLALDCAQPFEAQATAIAAQPGIRPAAEEPGEPYAFYSTESGDASWMVTKPGAPGHPAILMQRAGGGKVVTTGCPYGDKAGYDQLVAYLDGLKAARGR